MYSLEYTEWTCRILFLRTLVFIRCTFYLTIEIFFLSFFYTYQGAVIFKGLNISSPPPYYGCFLLLWEHSVINSSAHSNY